MTREQIIQYFKEGDFKEVSREHVLEYLFQSGEVLFSDYLYLQRYLEKEWIKRWNNTNIITIGKNDE